MAKRIPRPVYLSGFMGSGKSTLGQKLARRLQVSFVDLDEEIENLTGRTIPEIFDVHGEREFRRLERKVLLQLTRQSRGVVSLGGGSLQDQDIIQQLKQSGVLVFIEVPLPVLLDRITADTNRPLLTNDRGKPKRQEVLQAEMSALYKRRLPKYQQAHITLTGEGSESATQLVEQLINKITYYVSN